MSHFYVTQEEMDNRADENLKRFMADCTFRRALADCKQDLSWAHELAALELAKVGGVICTTEIKTNEPVTVDSNAPEYHR